MPDPWRYAGTGTVAVVGASLSGLLAAAGAAEAGRRVVVLERDTLAGADGWRRGVPQGRQIHVLLHRGLVAAEELVPGLEVALEGAGAVRVNTGELPWYGPFGWQPTWIRSYDLLSVTRPLLERLVRERVLARPGVELVDGVRVRGLRPAAAGWQLLCSDGLRVEADMVVDASGRSSRMPQWLAELGYAVPEPEVLDASLAYACQVFRSPGAPLRTGVVVGATPERPRSGLGLPVEGGQWLVSAAGYGPERPGRDMDLRSYLARLREPVLAEITATLEPVGEVAVHRQTSNRRHGYGLARDWPEGLLVVGDALCCFNPLYGQGITVGALQAGVLRDALRRRGPLATRGLQRDLRRVADVPWSVATTEDTRYLPGARPTIKQRLLSGWTNELAAIATAGHQRAVRTFGGVYHLMTPPVELFHPALVAGVVRGRLSRLPGPAARPAVLQALVDAPAR